MEKRSLIQSVLICFGLNFLMMYGCASSPPARFYTLNSISFPINNTKTQPLDKGLTLGLGPLRFPDYLNRPGIVTRTGVNSLEIAEFDLWAGSLKEDFIRVLVDNLSILLEPENIALYPFRGGGISTSLLILLTVDRFDGDLGGEVLLEATWVILEGSGKKEGISQKSRIAEPVKGSDYRSLVSAQSRALERLSREIALAVQALPSFKGAPVK